MTIPETENEQENSTEQEDNESLTQPINETGKADSSLKKRKQPMTPNNIETMQI